MNNIEERNFPYPILLENGGDYIDSYFHVDCLSTLSKDKKNIEIKFNFDLKCEFINTLLNDGKVILAVKITQRTYRIVIFLTGKEISIPVDELSPNYNLEIIPMIIAKTDISFSYQKCMDIAFSFFDEDFTVKKYQILGYGSVMSIELPINTKVGSIFTISKIKAEADIAKKIPYIITFDNQTIDIKVLPDIFESFYNSLQKNATFNKILYSTFVYPAIQLAILTIMQDYDNVKDLKWCIAITNKIAKEKHIILNGTSDVSRDDIVEYTHIILETLLQDAFYDIEHGGDSE